MFMIKASNIYEDEKIQGAKNHKTWIIFQYQLDWDCHHLPGSLRFQASMCLLSSVKLLLIYSDLSESRIRWKNHPVLIGDRNERCLWFLSGGEMTLSIAVIYEICRNCSGEFALKPFLSVEFLLKGMCFIDEIEIAVSDTISHWMTIQTHILQTQNYITY